MSIELTHRDVTTNGIRLHVVEAGPRDGPLVILLHGFPEFWYAWHRQLEPLAAAGFRLIVPDQRGYNLSHKPRGVSAYRLDEMVQDVVGLIDDAGRDRACVAGHDWGGAVAWWMGITQPRRLRRLACLNIPHPAVMRRHLASNPAQRRRSRYMFFNQLPWLPELAMRSRQWQKGLQALRGSSRPGTFSAADLELYRAAWSQPGAPTAMFNWYRAAMRAQPRRPASQRVTVPTLLIWGTGDRFLGSEMAQPSIDLCDDGRLLLIEGASHWVQHEEPERVTALLRDFFAGTENGTGSGKGPAG
jgi:pimeloyl-ACP methyl ester carboxylesterase